ncbi:tripartite tricarboxylate transporter substrate binding protein [Orrella sp. JC864]|uniref:Bug family tripartite tricarboxylate transporter substrate binding protein n=1 Tax=Orrella sp. JC864 TaxID=3120298 RepID=UPI0030089500
MKNFATTLERAARLGVLVLACAAAGLARAEPFPSRPVSLIVPYGPGGVVDITARALAEGLGKHWGQPVIVENKPGAAGALGAAAAAKSKGDGYTLFYADDGVLVSMPHFNPNLTYDTLGDLKAVAMTGTYPYVVMANANAGFRSLQELVDRARQKPGGIDYATNGIGSTHHLAWERFQRQAGIKLNHVPYKSAAPAVQDVMAGHLPVMTVSIGTVVPLLKDARVVFLASLGERRSALLPEVATATELGYERFSATGWLGLYAPASADDALVQQINEAVRAVVQTEKFRQAMHNGGIEPQSPPVAQVAARFRQEYERNGKDISAMQLRAQ